MKISKNDIEKMKKLNENQGLIGEVPLTPEEKEIVLIAINYTINQFS